jgi:hypothetical protein
MAAPPLGVHYWEIVWFCAQVGLIYNERPSTVNCPAQHDRCGWVKMVMVESYRPSAAPDIGGWISD